ncbi:hypothetical protein DPMN_048825 [Dreissena polymorpha]|uniref:Uncharacterized protein n=1 Tax=Dreissena polymorpha TaxID=45954 RepID=A0A9D4I4B0_DREPO|nr:hypothetical protein DPMN_048825 [Dreissena polymorpha]
MYLLRGADMFPHNMEGKSTDPSRVNVPPRICRTTCRLLQASSNSPTNIPSCWAPLSLTPLIALALPTHPFSTTSNKFYHPSTSSKDSVGCTPTADPKPVTQGYSLG